MPEVTFTIVAMLGLVVVGLWIGLVATTFRPGRLRRFGVIALQVSLAAAFWSLLRGDPAGALIVAAFPPIALLSVPHDYSALLGQILGPALVAGGAIFLPLALRPQWRLFSLAPALIAAISAGAVAGEVVSRREMCRAAAAQRIQSFRRHNFFCSLRNAPQEFQFEIHAAGEADGRRYGWSYREMAWYPIPSDTSGEVEQPPFACAQPATSV